MNKNIIAGHKSEELMNYLLKRRSVNVKDLSKPAPTRQEIEEILTAAARVPDHGKAFPWYFLIFEGENRNKIGNILRKSYKNTNIDATEAKLELESELFLRAPLIIAVIARIRKAKHPVLEQILSAGAVCQNLILAANALGYGTNWLTQWYSYNDEFKKELGLDERDNVAGFIYIGTPTKQPEERDRPDISKITTYWEPNIELNKGDNIYDKPTFNIPDAKINTGK